VLSFISDKKYKAKLAAEAEKENSSTLFEKDGEKNESGMAEEEKTEDKIEESKHNSEEQEKNDDGKDN
jgi:hypothetical protein